MAPRRLPDWPERLAALIESRRRQPFGWGSNDCVTFAADAIVALTGVDLLLEGLRGRWDSQDGATATMDELGGLLRAVMDRLGKPLAPGARAPRGAVVLADMAGVATMGVRVTGDRWCAPGAAGLVFRPAAEVRLAWGI